MIKAYYRQYSPRYKEGPYSLKVNGCRPYKIEVSQDIWDKEFVRNKLALSLDPKDCEGIILVK